MSKLIVSLCDYSGHWSQPYRDAGYEVIQVDLKLGQDARLFKKVSRPVHGILCAPVCTAFSGAGAKHWAAKEAEGNTQLLDGLALVDACIRIVHVHKPVFWVLENPVGRLRDWLGQSVFTFNPYEYAGWVNDPDESYTKRTCLWGDFNEPEKKPLLAPDGKSIHGSKMWSKYGGSSDRTKEMRSMTPRGFAHAFFAANP
ncbi:MAG: DNA cytosine methyltransferase [Rhizobiales bacterium]|nr:DNA cytosine methyltransferase [Hyphomicrobiales bacterium]